MNKEFEGKVALITGASSSIGRACTLAFARRGAKVVIADVLVEGSRETLHLIQEANGDAFFFKCNVSNSIEVEALIHEIGQTHGRLDYACNNAGIEGTPALTADYSEEMWNRVISINLTGVWLCMKYEISLMLQRGGVIVNMASTLGTVGFAGASAYAASKHGLIGLTRTAALEYAHQGIRINAVCPSLVYTPALHPVGIQEDTGPDTELYTMSADLHPLKRTGTPEEVAETVAWLCSDAAGCTGHAMPVEEGWLA